MVLAAISNPCHDWCGKGNALVATLKSDLRNLVTAEEGYFAENMTYTATLDTTIFRPWAGNTVTILEASASGWSAVAIGHDSMAVCGVFVGTPPPIPPPVADQAEGEPGVPYCRNDKALRDSLARNGATPVW